MEDIWISVQLGRYKSAFYATEANSSAGENQQESNLIRFCICLKLRLYRMAQEIYETRCPVFCANHPHSTLISECLVFMRLYLESRETHPRPQINLSKPLNSILLELSTWRKRLASHLKDPDAEDFGAPRFHSKPDDSMRSTFTMLHPWHPLYREGLSEWHSLAQQLKSPPTQTIDCFSTQIQLVFLSAENIDTLVEQSCLYVNHHLASRGNTATKCIHEWVLSEYPAFVRNVITEGTWKLQLLSDDADCKSFAPLDFSNIEDYVVWIEQPRRLNLGCLLFQGIPVTHYLWTDDDLACELPHNPVYIHHPGQEVFSQCMAYASSQWKSSFEVVRTGDEEKTVNPEKTNSAALTLFLVAHCLPFRRGTASCVEELLMQIRSAPGPGLSLPCLQKRPWITFGSGILFNPILSMWMD